MCMCLSVCVQISGGGGAEGGRKGVRQGQDRIMHGEGGRKGGLLFDFEGQWVGSFLKDKKN